jgi:VWFA-related protein
MKKAGRIAFGLAALTLAGFAQGPTVIRTETRLVLVDAVVRDKDGRIERDLIAKDFRVWEDGKEQKITSFNRENAGMAAESAQPQYLVFLFDAPAVGDQKAREAVGSFLAGYAGPGRYAAVVSYALNLGIVQNFTTLAGRLQRALTDPDLKVTPGEMSERNSGAGIAQLVGPALGRGTIVAVASGSQPDAGPPGAVTARNAIAAPFLLVLGGLKDLADGMFAIRGRKVVVELGFGLHGDSPVKAPDDQTERVAQTCNRANVAVYTTDASIRKLAAETGGRVIKGSDLANELGEIASEQDEHYVLGYVPRDWPEGSCHTLRVRVGREGLEVRARQGYCTVKPPDMLAGKEAGKPLEERAAGADNGTVAASMRLPYFYVGPNVALIDLAMETAPLDLKFEKVNGKRHAELAVVGQAFEADGGVAGRFSETLKLDFDTDEEAEAFRKQPYRYEHQFRLAAGQYKVRVAFGVGERVLGKAEAPLEIGPWDGKQTALSGIALARGSRTVADLTADLDPALLEGKKSLTARSMEIVPSGVNRCSRDTDCLAYLEAYDAGFAEGDQEKKNADGLAESVGTPGRLTSLQIRVLDNSGGVADTGEFPLKDYLRSGSAVAPVILSVPVKALAPGRYTLEVKAETARRTVDFEVE